MRENHRLGTRPRGASLQVVGTSCCPSSWSRCQESAVIGESGGEKGGSAEVALSSIGKLYVAEGQRKRYQDPAAFAAERRRLVEPVLKDFHAWLQRRASQVPPEMLLGKAVNYALIQWPKLLRYLEHPAMTPDTNACENAIRPCVVGRKNWLFSGSPRGAGASASLYSFIETQKANRREPYFHRMLTLAAVEPRRSTAGTR